MKRLHALTLILCLALLVAVLIGCSPPAASFVETEPTCPPVEPAPTCPPPDPCPTCPTPEPVPTCPTPEPVPTCPPPEPAASSDPSEAVAVAESLVQGYIRAWENRDADEYFAVWSPDGTFMEHADNNEFIIELTESWIRNDLEKSDRRTTIDSYFISHDGRHAALQIQLTVFIKDGKPVTVPGALIFTFEDGQIVHADLYHDEDAWQEYD
jgi:ketosteroid isomerase-like protein